MVIQFRKREIIIRMKKNRTNLLFILFSILFVIYIAVVLKITVFRSSFGLHHLFQNGSLNLVPFTGYMIFVKSKNWFRFIYLFGGNIVWFMPFGMYLQYTKKLKSILTVTLCGLLFSLCIETMQYVFGTGISELDDLILNTFGAWIGAVGVKLFQSKKNKPDKSNPSTN